MRTALTEVAEISRRIDELEARYDAGFQEVFDAIRSLMQLPGAPQRPIGFIAPSRGTRKRETS
jgi:hypothetical protein